MIPAGAYMIRIFRTLLLTATPLLSAACLADHPATITYAWAPPYTPNLLAIRLGDQRIAGEAFQLVPGAPNRLEIFTQAPTGTVPLEISLLLRADTLVAVRTSITLQAGRHFTLQIAAGLIAPGFTLPCAHQLGPTPIRGGLPTDSLAVQWFETDPSTLVGPC